MLRLAKNLLRQLEMIMHNMNIHMYSVQGGPKRVILVDMAITALKSIRKGKSWFVLENSAYMLQDWHRTFQN